MPLHYSPVWTVELWTTTWICPHHTLELGEGPWASA